MEKLVVTLNETPETPPARGGQTDAPTESRRTLVRELLITETTQKCADIYGQLVEIVDNGSPEFERLGSYAARDILDTILDHVYTIYQPTGKRTSLGTLTDNLEVSWQKLSWQSPQFTALSEEKRAQKIQKYLKDSEQFFTKKQAATGPRRTDSLRAAVGMYRGFREVPESAYKGYSIQWFTLKDYFDRVGHGSAADRAQFKSKMEDLERLIIHLLEKTAAKDLLGLKDLIEEGESS